VKIYLVITGIVLVLVALPGYSMAPGFISDEVNKLTGGNASDSMTSSLLTQMGIPPIGTIIPMVEYSFVGLGVAGFGLTIFGIVTKNFKSQIYVESLEINSSDSSEKPPMPTALWILQERLAKGEITSSQYKNMRRLLEEKNK
jgi:uncharacterized membrane protein